MTTKQQSKVRKLSQSELALVAGGILSRPSPLPSPTGPTNPNPPSSPWEP